MMYAAVILAFDTKGSGLVLAISRGADQDNWGLVGGKVEPSESPIEAALREADEEAGLISKPQFLVPVYTGVARTRMTTTFLVTDFDALPDPLPSTREGAVAFLSPHILCRPSCTYQDYNTRLFRHLGLFT